MPEPEMSETEQDPATPPVAAAAGMQAPLAVLAGGRSGGHVFPLLAVGAELERRGWRVTLFGAPRSLEERLARERGVNFVALASRAFVGRGLLARVAAAFVLLRSALRARALLRRADAAIVVASGGFVAAPTVLGSWLARRPVLLIEPNARAGLANRALSRLATRAAIAHAETALDLRCPSEVLGVPVRTSFSSLGPPTSGARLRLLVLGGSQGAERLNRTLPEALASLDDLALEARHQTGAANLDATLLRYARSFQAAPDGAFERGGVSVDVVAFIDDVAAALGWSELVISRAGAITMAEICAAGRAAILVPLSGAASGHQTDNARALLRAGAALMIDEEELPSLAPLLRELAGDRSRLRALGARARELAQPEAAVKIADRVEALSARRVAA
jgi:UDP-N-acetylglucosamine--N-acetylmuramyl-(pentapeptide) pyrophosphoryl-undecaprenol N-acetylglucosamine transferase